MNDELRHARHTPQQCLQFTLPHVKPSCAAAVIFSNLAVSLIATEAETVLYKAGNDTGNLAAGAQKSDEQFRHSVSL